MGGKASLQTKLFILNKRIYHWCEGQINKISRTPDGDNRWFYPWEKIKNKQPHPGRMWLRVVIILLKLRHHVTTQHIQDFLEVFFMFFQYKISGEKEKESIIHVRMG